MKRFRVAHLITRLCQGGAQENTFHTVRLANRERFDADLISGPTTGSEGSIEDAIDAAGIAIHREPNLIRNIDPLRDIRALASLTRRFRRERYDIVHTHTSKAGLLGRIAARRAGVPIVVHTPHGNIFDGYFSPLLTAAFTQVERYAARKADRLIELTAGGIEEHLDRRIGRREQYRVIFSGIDLGPYETAIASREATRAALGLGQDDLAVAAVGRLETVKGFAYFLDAAAILAQSHPNARFIVVGNGALEAELKSRAQSLGERVQFLGFRSDIPALMAAMDVLVVPSLNEGMGRVILEAGAAATPVVASRVGGIPDVVRHGETGLLVPPKNPQAIAEATATLLGDPTRRNAMGRAARAHIAPAFGLERMVKQIEALYEELIGEKNLDAG